jgi:hypothetical protein
MTQRTWTTEDGWQVLTGWDRPLQHFFLQISRECTKCGGDGSILDNYIENDCDACKGRGEQFLFDNLSDKTGMTNRMGGMSLNQIASVLQSNLTAYPKDILKFLLDDCRRDLSNARAVHETIGRVK